MKIIIIIIRDWSVYRRYIQAIPHFREQLDHNSLFERTQMIGVLQNFSNLQNLKFPRIEKCFRSLDKLLIGFPEAQLYLNSGKAKSLSDLLLRPYPSWILII